METWYSISEIAEQLNIAENTARRYANLFKAFLHDKQFGRTTKYTADAIRVIRRISLLYQQGMNTHDITAILANEMPQTIDIDDEAAVTPIVSPQELMAQLNESLQQIAAATEQIAEQEEFRMKQEAFNQALAERLEQQEAYIEESLRKRDEQLMSVVRGMLEAKKKKWWQVWK